jgi:hypothetical protein
LRLGFGPFQYEIRTGDYLDVVEYSPVLQIDAADLAAPDYADSYRRIFADGRSFQSLSISASQLIAGASSC